MTGKTKIKMELMKKDIINKELTQIMTLNRVEWWKKIADYNLLIKNSCSPP